VLAYLVRLAYAHGERAAAERIFAVLWDRFAAHVIFYAQGYRSRLRRGVEAEDVVVDVFATLCARLRSAEGCTFYEACFLFGLKRLTLDKVQRMPDEPLVSLTQTREEGEEEEQRDLEDREAPDPREQAERGEQRSELRQALPSRLHGLPDRARHTAWLLMQGRSEGEIAATLGVSTRMVTNYKAAIRTALDGLQGI
jgi:DNA-directed RNA polymerase specialized sigma24 family protein